MVAISQHAAVLLMELIHRGIELDVRADRLRYRPRSTMTADLAVRVKTHKVELLAILGAVDGQNRAGSPQCTTEKRRLRTAWIIRQARQAGDYNQAVVLREAWRERMAICIFDGGLTIEAAEKVALTELENHASLKEKHKD